MKRRTFIASAILGGALIKIGCGTSGRPLTAPALLQLAGKDEWTLIMDDIHQNLGSDEKISSEWDELPLSPEEQIRKDYEEGNIVVAGGWILSRTEAMQCALFNALKKVNAH
jgi:hypothetical protein